MGNPTTNYDIAARRIYVPHSKLPTQLRTLSELNDSLHFGKYLHMNICTHSVNADSEIFISANLFPPQYSVFKI